MAFTKYKIVITRKEHKCSSCGCTINKNQVAKYGVTTDSEHTCSLLACYWCSSCMN
ncbi:hypothetical protein [Clostridium sp.]|uniref:hypothetical protein n=1 Tax=Clostridium sp. TaxID=1506 RepID=UPI003F4C6BEC